MLDSADRRGKEAALRGESWIAWNGKTIPQRGSQVPPGCSHTSCLHITSLHNRAMDGIRRGNAPDLTCICTDPRTDQPRRDPSE